MHLSKIIDKPLGKDDAPWKDWASVVCLLSITLVCLASNGMSWEKSKNHRLALTAFGFVSSALALAKVREIEQKQFLLDARHGMRQEMLTEAGVVQWAQEHQDVVTQLINRQQSQQPPQVQYQPIPQPYPQPVQQPVYHQAQETFMQSAPTEIQEPVYQEPDYPQDVVYESFNGLDVYPLDPIKLKKQNTGLLVCGSSGAAKTTMVRWCLPYWIAEGYEIIVLDPHADMDNPEYPWADFPYVLGEKREIFQQIEILSDLLEKKDKAKVICIADEWTDLIGFAQMESKQTYDLLRRFLISWGTGGRKFNKFLIGIGHTDNVEMWGLKGIGGLLRNFGILRLGDIATRYAEFKGTNNNPLFDYCKETAYPLLVNDEIHLHPTHGHYQVKEGGQAPIGLQPLAFNPLTIPYVADMGSKRQAPPSNPLEMQKSQIQLPKLADPEPLPSIENPRAFLERAFELEARLPGDQCPSCHSDNIGPHGKTAAGTPRVRCKDCGKTWAV